MVLARVGPATMKRNLVSGVLLLFQKVAHAGGAPYVWLDVRSGDGQIYGLGEVSNNLAFFLGDHVWISPIPGFVSYQKYYSCLMFIMVLALMALLNKSKLSNGHDQIS